MKRISVKVTPKASKPRIEKDLLPDEHGNDFYKVWVRAVPEDGKANKEVVEMMAELLGVAKSRVKIIRGDANKNKVLEVDC